MKKYKVTLTADERRHLRELIAAGKAAAQKLAHARILLKADAAPGGPAWPDGRIADAVEVSSDTVARVRQRLVEEGLDAVLDVYHRAYDARRPVVALDEASKQLVGETVRPLPPEPGQPERFDYEYVRNGTANLFMMSEPLAGWRHAMVTDRRTAKDFAEAVRWLAEDVYPEAEKLVLVMDDLNTHKLASLYEAFPPEQARRIAERIEVHHTPKHGSWLNVAEIELSVLARQCLDRRIESVEELLTALEPWELDRNDRKVGIEWRFTTADARIKLRRLYPAIE